MIIIFWPGISQILARWFLRTPTIVNNARYLQSVWCKSIIRCLRGVYLHLLKVFDRVLHDGLLYKLMSLGICENYYGLIHSFLSDRHWRLILNSQSSKWSHIKAGVPQGSILGPLLFLVYTNDLPEALAQMIPHYFQWFLILQDLQHFFMMTYWKCFVGLTSERWYLTQMPQNRLKRLFSFAKQAQVTTKLFILTM